MFITYNPCASLWMSTCLFSNLSKEMVTNANNLFAFTIVIGLIFFILFCFCNCPGSLISEHIIVILRRWRTFLTFLYVFHWKIIILIILLNFLYKTFRNQCSNFWIIFSPCILFLLLWFIFWLLLLIFVLYILNLCFFLLFDYLNINILLLLSFLPIVFF